MIFNEDTETFEQLEKGFIYMYSFALNPNNYEPSGTCNFSEINTAVLKLVLAETFPIILEGVPIQELRFPKIVEVYAINYNILKIMSGMGGLSYSN